MSTQLDRLTEWVYFRINFIKTKPESERPGLVRMWCDWLDSQLIALGQDPTPKHLEGLTAFDIANARDKIAGLA